IRTGHQRTFEGEHSEPLFNTSSYVFDSAADAAAKFAGEVEGNVYSRYTNPTVRTFQDRMAALEGAEAAVATASGMAAILSVCMSLLAPGEQVLVSRSVFGTTSNLFSKFLVKYGIEVGFVDVADLDQWRNAVRGNTRMLFLETPSNPLCEVADIKALSALAKQHGARLVVDNCFCTPALQQPLKLGADIVVHSATKYLDGQGRCVGGVALGNAADMEQVLGFVRTAGPTMAAFNAWVFLKGIETLRLRMDAHCANAQALAQWLQQQAQVEQVFYAGLESHPGHKLAKQQQRGFGGVLSFKLAIVDQSAQRAGAWAFIDATEMVSLTANLGDVKTTIVHPATTTHSRLSDAEKQQAGISENLIRVAVGLEAIDDIIADLSKGFAALG
ncbi:MAG: O-succinylhomoserine sulfhydrylase, partial [Cellvibrionaceae bacterium]|nr:O-succinylhomoserine sulfhydrylase [Cellvibrionaceae bacterium]